MCLGPSGLHRHMLLWLFNYLPLLNKKCFSGIKGRSLPAVKWGSCMDRDLTFGILEKVDNSEMCPSSTVYLLTLCMRLSSDGLNLQVINMINNNLTKYMRQFIQVHRGKSQEFLTTGEESIKPTLKAYVRRLKFYSSNSSSTSSKHFGLIKDVKF